jgi:hypothetical protein
MPAPRRITGRLPRRYRPGDRRRISGADYRRAPGAQAAAFRRRAGRQPRGAAAAAALRAGGRDAGAGPLAHPRRARPRENPLDPYNTNTLKADKPVFGDDWFVNVGAIADTLYEPARVPTGIGAQYTARPGGEQHLRPLRPHADQRDRHPGAGADQGRHRVQAARSRIRDHPGVQFQLHDGRRGRRAQHQPDEGPDPRR